MLMGPSRFFVLCSELFFFLSKDLTRALPPLVINGAGGEERKMKDVVSY